MEEIANPNHVIAYLAFAVYILAKDVIPWVRNKKNGKNPKNAQYNALSETIDRGFTRMDDWIHGHEEFSKRQIEEFATNKAERQEIFRRLESLERHANWR